MALENPYLLRHTMEFLGQGESSFVRADKLWHTTYANLFGKCTGVQAVSESLGRIEVRPCLVPPPHVSSHLLTPRQVAVEEGCPLRCRLFSVVAGRGDLAACKLLKSLDCPWDEDTCLAAARGGHLAVLKWLRERDPWAYDEACNDDDAADMCTDAASGGHLAVLQWLREGDDPCPWNADTAAAAASGGDLHVLRWMRKGDACPWNADTSTAAASGGHLHVLKWLRKGDDPCPWDADTATAAASGGHLHVLKWLVKGEDPCPLGERLMHSAACWGHLHVMKWARERGCAWDVDVFRWAASGGFIHVLQWLREGDDPCPWDGACNSARSGAQLKTLQWLREAGCPWDASACPYSYHYVGLKMTDKAKELAAWVHENGHPCDCL